MWTGPGRLTVEMERAHRAETGEQLHVYINGFDVTSRAFLADTQLQFVYVFCRDQISHHPMQSIGELHRNSNYPNVLCVHRLDGDVVIKPGASFESSKTNH